MSKLRKFVFSEKAKNEVECFNNVVAQKRKEICFPFEIGREGEREKKKEGEREV